MRRDATCDECPGITFTLVSQSELVDEELQRIAEVLARVGKQVTAHSLFEEARALQAPEWDVVVAFVPLRESAEELLSTFSAASCSSLAPLPTLDDLIASGQAMFGFRKYVSKYFAFLYDENTQTLHARPPPMFWEDAAWPEVELPAVVAECGFDCAADSAVARRAGRFAIACALADNPELATLVTRKALLESSSLFYEIHLGTQTVLTPEHFRHQAAAGKCLIARQQALQKFASKLPERVLALERRDLEAAQLNILHWESISALFSAGVAALDKPALIALARFQMIHLKGAWLVAVRFD